MYKFFRMSWFNRFSLKKFSITNCLTIHKSDFFIAKSVKKLRKRDPHPEFRPGGESGMGAVCGEGVRGQGCQGMSGDVRGGEGVAPTVHGWRDTHVKLDQTVPHCQHT